MSNQKLSDKIKAIKQQDDDYDPHVACFSYPNCDEQSSGCLLETNSDDIEESGHH